MTATRTEAPVEARPSERRLRVLHVIAGLGPTNAQYHEHCLPLLDERDFVLCSLLPARLDPPEGVELVQGDGTRRGAWRALRSALRSAEHDVAHAHVPGAAALLAVATATDRSARARTVYSMTNSWESYRRRNRLLLWGVLATVPQVVLCSDAVRDSLPRPLARLTRGRATVVPNGVDVRRIREVVAAMPPRPATAGPLTVVSPSRLVPIKDPLALLAAFGRARRPGDRLVFLGDGPLREPLVAAARAAGLADAVEVAGLVPRDEVYRRVARADVVVSSSHGEGLPVAVLEAMACGCPVVLSDIAPHREIAEHVPGLPLVPPGDVAGLAAALERFRGSDPAERARLGALGRGAVERHYGVDVMHRGLAPVYARARATSSLERTDRDG